MLYSCKTLQGDQIFINFLYWLNSMYFNSIESKFHMRSSSDLLFYARQLSDLHCAYLAAFILHTSWNLPQDEQLHWSICPAFATLMYIIQIASEWSLARERIVNFMVQLTDSPQCIISAFKFPSACHKKKDADLEAIRLTLCMNADHAFLDSMLVYRAQVQNIEISWERNETNVISIESTVSVSSNLIL